MKNVLSCLVALCVCSQVFSQEYTKEIVQYRAGEEKCYAEVSYKEGLSDRPVIIWFHAGGLTKGSAKTPDVLLTKDYLVVSSAYRFYPDVTVREIIDDAAMAVSWVVANASKYGGSSSKIYLAGHSAGGYLVSMLALDKTYLAKYNVDADMFAGIIPFSGQMITHFTERRSRGQEMTKVVVDEMAPLYHMRADAPPFMIITGDRDLELTRRYEENAYFYEMMKFIGHKDMILHELDGFNHGGMGKPGFFLLLDYIGKRSK